MNFLVWLGKFCKKENEHNLDALRGIQRMNTLLLIVLLKSLNPSSTVEHKLLIPYSSLWSPLAIDNRFTLCVVVSRDHDGGDPAK